MVAEPTAPDAPQAASPESLSPQGSPSWDAPSGSSSARSWLVALLLVGAAIFAWQWLANLERVNALEAEVAALHGQLGRAEVDLAAWASHMGTVRGVVDGVAGQLGALQLLVAENPVGSVAPAAAEDASE